MPRPLAFLFALCVCLSAQPAVRQLTAVLTSGAKGQTIHLRNDYSSPATAWVLQCQTQTGAWRFYFDDQELSLPPKPLAPRAAIDFPFIQMRANDEHVGTCSTISVAAAVFADGSASGNLTWINAIVAGRQLTYQEIGAATDQLAAAIARHASPTELDAQLASKHSFRWTPVAGYRDHSSDAAGPFEFSTVPATAQWLAAHNASNLPATLKALDDWRLRLAKLPPVVQTGAPRRLTIPSASQLAPGQPAPGFQLSDLDGNPVALADLRGKVVLLEFWAAHCIPCRQSMPHMQMLAERYREQGLIVLGINTADTADVAKKFLTDKPFTYRHLIAVDTPVVEQYAANTIPETVLIDREGIIRFLHTGWPAGMDLTPEIAKLLH